MDIIKVEIFSIILCIFMVLKQIHIIQLNSYNFDQQVIWYKKNYKLFVLNLVLLLLLVINYELKIYPIYIFIIIDLLGLFIINFPKKQKKKLVFTKRIIRLIFVCIILHLPFFLIRQLDLSYVVVAISPILIFVSYLISLPIENSIRRNYMNNAKNVLASQNNLKVIAITGSFGKTSVKYYLSEILKSKYNVCITPGSYNTPMGATLTINNGLRSFDDYFICEMGARRVGDIKEICDIVTPSIGIVTDVGLMHLDTFKNIENVAKTKFELIDFIASRHDKGIVFVNGDNEIIKEKIRRYKDRQEKIEIYTYGLNKDNDYVAINIRQDASGSSFSVYFDDDTVDVETKLLGKYNILNLVCAIGLSLKLGIDKNSIIKEVKKLKPVQHRLELVSLDPNNLIIDDAYNANPKGAKNSVDVLNGFENYKKIIITPGMVELGDRQNSENEDFATYASEKVDYALVVGNTNKNSLINGFKKCLDENHLIYFDNVEMAIYYARTNIEGKKIILLENDLSDNY